MSTARRQANTRTLKARKRRRPWRYAILGLGFGERIAHLSRLTQLLVFLIVTCRRRCSVPGVIPLGEAGLAEVVRWPLDDVRTGVTEAEAAGIIQRDESPLLFLRLALDEDPPANVHVLGAWHRELDNLPKSELVSVVRAAIGTLLDGEMLAEWQS